MSLQVVWVSDDDSIAIIETDTRQIEIGLVLGIDGFMHIDKCPIALTAKQRDKIEGMVFTHSWSESDTGTDDG